LVAFSENSEKLTPPPSQMAPSGYGFPGQIFIALTLSSFDSYSYNVVQVK
jgi:hypothetical protein